jgi:hypothetical protein
LRSWGGVPRLYGKFMGRWCCRRFRRACAACGGRPLWRR